MVRILFDGVKNHDSAGASASYERLLKLSRKIVKILTTIGYDDFIKWDPSLSVNVSSFDEHHR